MKAKDIEPPRNAENTEKQIEISVNSTSPCLYPITRHLNQTKYLQAIVFNMFNQKFLIVDAL